MIDERPVLRLLGCGRSEARELAESVGAEAAILSEESLPIGGYGDVGTRIVAVPVLADTVTVLVEIDDAAGTRHKETLTYKAVPGQGAIQAAQAALRALPGIAEALERSPW